MTTEDPEYMPSIEECAKRGRPFIEIPYEKDRSLRQLITFFGFKYNNGISRHRMQLISFYTDYRFYQMHEEQLTNVQYRPYMYGFAGEKINRELENSPLKETTMWEKGRSVEAFSLNTGLPDGMEEDLVKFFEQIHTETKEVSTEDLETFTKNTPAFEMTSYEDVLNFTDATVDSMDSYSA